MYILFIHDRLLWFLHKSRFIEIFYKDRVTVPVTTLLRFMNLNVLSCEMSLA